MTKQRWIRALVSVAVAGLSMFAVGGVAVAGPAGAPNFGVMDPLDSNPNTYFSPGGPVVFTGSCPWPNLVDAALPEVGKCMPKAIAWSENGVRIVSDPLVGNGTGQFTFWCQTRTGLRFILTVQGLSPNTVYPVTASAFGTIASVRTDPHGNGVVGGSVSLDPGGYDTSIAVGTALHTLASDPIDFEVF